MSQSKLLGEEGGLYGSWEGLQPRAEWLVWEALVLLVDAHFLEVGP